MNNVEALETLERLFTEKKKKVTTISNSDPVPIAASADNPKTRTKESIVTASANPRSPREAEEKGSDDGKPKAAEKKSGSSTKGKKSSEKGKSSSPTQKKNRKKGEKEDDEKGKDELMKQVEKDLKKQGGGKGFKTLHFLSGKKKKAPKAGTYLCW